MKHLFVVILLGMLYCGAAHAQKTLTYTVKSGDTLHHIARKYGLTVEGLMRINGITSSLIRIDQVLQLPSKSPTRLPEILPTGDLRSSLAEGQDELPVALKEPDGSPIGSGEPDVSIDGTREEALTAAIREDEIETVDYSEENDVSAADSADRDSLPADKSLQRVGDPVNSDQSTTFDRGLTKVASVPDELASNLDTTTYKVGEGETLYSIASDVRTKAYVLHVLNEGIRSPLEPGMSLVIPAAAGSDPSSGFQVYAVGTVDVLPNAGGGFVVAGGDGSDAPEFVVGHPLLPFDSILIVENAATGRAAFARVADRSPADSPHLIHVSPALASEIDVESGTQVRIRLIE